MPRPLPGDSPYLVLDGFVSCSAGSGDDPRRSSAEFEAWTVEAGAGTPARGEEGAIGIVRFPTHRGEPAEAILDGDGRWRCPQLPVLDRVLNALYDPSRKGHSGDGFGYAEVQAVASWLKGAKVHHFRWTAGPPKGQGAGRR